MAKKYLIVNPGSSSLKFSIYEGRREVTFRHYEDLLSAKAVETTLDNFLPSVSGIAKIGIRIVNPGNFFQKDRLINDLFMRKLSVWDVDPAHSQKLVIIKKLKRIFPGVPMIGVSDSSFHSHLPDVARYYALPKTEAERLEIFRFGYHGLSCESAVDEIKKTFKSLPRRMVLCHLGSGCSITALKNGKSIDTSMGFSPLEGLVMSSRSGDIDTAAAIYLAKKKKFDFEKLQNYLFNKSGLLGLSGQSADLRVILKSKEPGVKLAAAMFVYRIVKYIGAYSAALGGLDYLVFTGTVGERSVVIRKKICDKLPSRVKTIVVNSGENTAILKHLL